MSHRRRLLVRPAGALACLSLLVAAPAGADTPEYTLQRTYPLPVRICSKTREGPAPRPVREAADQVLAACSKLESEFAAALETMTNGVNAVHEQLAADHESTRSSCQASGAGAAAACTDARAQLAETRQGLVQQHIALVKTFHQAVRSIRHTFWASYKAAHQAAKAIRDAAREQRQAAREQRQAARSGHA